jgi:hypothetical protein
VVFYVVNCFIALPVVLAEQFSTPNSVSNPRVLPRRRWKDNIKMNLQEVECGGMDRIDMTQDRDRWRALVNA